MTWLNPIAFVGLLALGVPLLVHLFGRPRARRVMFPSLRFIQVTRQAPIRRSRPNDWILLILRSVIVALAVLALARPFWPGIAGARREWLARVIVVDTSLSMERPTSDGEPAAESARRSADSLAAEADEALVLATRDPGNALLGALEWLGARPGRHELTVISDFQLSALDTALLSSVPAETGIALVRMPLESMSDTIQIGGIVGEDSVSASLTLRGPETLVSWTRRPKASGRSSGISLLASDAEMPALQAALSAALSLSVSTSPDRPVAVVAAGYPGRAELLKETHAVSQPWQAGALVQIEQDELLRGLLDTAYVDAVPPTGLTPIIPPGSQRPVGWVGSTVMEGRETLVLFLLEGRGDIENAALLTAVLRAIDGATDIAEAEPSHLSDDVLERWNRPSTAEGAVNQAVNHGRWLWLGVLLLLALEWWIRRGSARVPTGASVPRQDSRNAA